METEEDVVGRRDQLEDDAFDVSLLLKVEGGGQRMAAWDDKHHDNNGQWGVGGTNNRVAVPCGNPRRGLGQQLCS
jgi:hypothetical protein